MPDQEDQPRQIFMSRRSRAALPVNEPARRVVTGALTLVSIAAVVIAVLTLA